MQEVRTNGTRGPLEPLPADNDAAMQKLTDSLMKKDVDHVEVRNVAQPAVSDVPLPVYQTKKWRKEIDAIIQEIKKAEVPSTPMGEDYRRSRERSLAITKLQEGVMWLGMDLKDMHQPNPYPASYDPTSAKIEPTADGLKL